MIPFRVCKDPRCGVNTHQTLRLCEACTYTEANQDWVSRETWEELAEDLDLVRRAPAEDAGLAALIDKPLRRVTDKQQRIAELALEKRPVRKRRRIGGRPRGWYTVMRAHSYRSAAQAAGTSPGYVARVWRKVYHED